MDDLIKWLREKADRARIAPFIAWVLFISIPGLLGGSDSRIGGWSQYLFYLAATIVVGWMVWVVRLVVKEMRWSVSWQAVVVGIAVFALWVGLDGLYPPLDPGKILSWDTARERSSNWDVFTFFGEGSVLAWVFIAVHILGSYIVVPPIEEALYRSFLYRWLIKEKFEDVPVGQWNKRSFIITCVIFGLVHGDMWLAGILCGALYQWLVIRQKSLGDAMTAHGITNFLLGIYIVVTQKWFFW